MHRFTLRFIVALITFAFGVAASTLWVIHRFSPTERSGVPQQPHSSAVSYNTVSEVPTVAFCDLLANPTDYSHKIIRLQAVLTVNDYVRSLSDSTSCLTPHPMVGVVLDPSFESESSNEAQRDVYDFLREEGRKAGSTRVTSVGRFEGPLLPEGSTFLRDKPASKYQYQHRFVIMRVEKAEPMTLQTKGSAVQSSKESRPQPHMTQYLLKKIP
jgi:hypothetical protein